MKVCPVCNAVAFDDAAMCFGCLHRFGEEAFEGSEQENELTEAGEPEVGFNGAHHFPSGAPGFLIRFAPNTDETGVITWSCTVELEQSYA